MLQKVRFDRTDPAEVGEQAQSSFRCRTPSYPAAARVANCQAYSDAARCADEGALGESFPQSGLVAFFKKCDEFFAPPFERKGVAYGEDDGIGVNSDPFCFAPEFSLACPPRSSDISPRQSGSFSKGVIGFGTKGVIVKVTFVARELFGALL